MDDLKTVSEVANILGISEAMVYKLVAAQKLNCLRIGLGRGTIRVSGQDLRAYLESCRQDEFVPEPAPPRRRKLKHIRLK